MSCPPASVPRRLLPVVVAAALAAGAVMPRAHAGETLVAVAANFTAAAQEIGAAFTEATGHTVTFSFGSTGKLYAQISHGAPFDAFLAADAARPEKAEAEGHAVPGSRFPYALGRIVLYSADPALVDDGGAVLEAPEAFGRLAIANPVTAPYGAAALEALEALDVLDQVRPKLVQGDSIAQTLQFVTTGNAPLGFVALSQVAGHEDGSRWLVPQNLYAPIRQDAVLLKHGADNDAAHAFLDYLQGPDAAAIMDRYGYGQSER
ncbi:molybdate ABC transporter substrate-binding protein [Roseospira navarrensis]|uniref:Molybdate ABC transporter substrate-binding protein n=1 Tax=Roseospira navarrensis TaxID=140058 RepID=A0A7X1ZCH8_9PROT|nr:molybdate ABC transporter substrate-binding protein [Roseospira navarrensis]MQX36014.1 molybdate ABC transporter substrate-binding protein [Roseospira navarrensis]